MTRARLGIVVCCVVAGCSSNPRDGEVAPGAGPTKPGGPSQPVHVLGAEVHLHQFPLGAHAWAAFVDPPLAIENLHGTSITEIDTTVTRMEGPCVLYVTPRCAPACEAHALCIADGVCQAITSWTYFDGGPIDVTGSASLPLLRLRFDGSGYASDPPPGEGLVLFDGGERLSIRGRGAQTALDLAFDAEVPAPPPVVVTAPSPSAELRLPQDAPFEVAWMAMGSDEVDVLVSASASDGNGATIRCATTDSGALTISASFMSALPPPPRITRLEVARTEQRVVPTSRAGVGVLVHAAFSAWQNGRD